ncbi:hypothetical protein [Aeromicrobium sp. HA]|uniref:hypothetical protein n=1 Tax=Aeromicrobium sp. HA TaxID=3009077 RepID=UPI0022AFACB3|nr:hypothetical protein [Aeromicrobium sp. HA]
MIGGDDWPKDPRLHPFREAVWELSRDGVIVGHLISDIWPMRSLPLFWKRQEHMWFALVWADGKVDRPNEDYGPDWCTVSELEQGFLDEGGDRFEARPLEGQDRDALWDRHKDLI